MVYGIKYFRDIELWELGHIDLQDKKEQTYGNFFKLPKDRKTLFIKNIKYLVKKSEKEGLWET